MTDVLVVSSSDLAVQSMIRLPLPLVVGNQDYAAKEALLRRMDALLVASGAEDAFVASWLAAARASSGSESGVLSDRRRATLQAQAVSALRCTVGRILSNVSHRSFSVHVAESALLHWFCRVERLDGVVQAPSKSTLQRMESEVPEEIIQGIMRGLVMRAAQPDGEGKPALALAEVVDLSVTWMDTTCAKLDMHYPTDWVLLRDVTRSVMASIHVIRSHGLKHRMPEPSSFVKAINQHAMAMSAASRKGRGGDKARARKKTLRAMKMVVSKVRLHGQRYRDLLAES